LARAKKYSQFLLVPGFSMIVTIKQTSAISVGEKIPFEINTIQQWCGLVKFGSGNKLTISNLIHPTQHVNSS
jgi:hypothetical protein